jgi:aspartyl-tRNA(Asn)/glutamyl-tRNA(Gln) amidotransferase subunit C
MRTMTIDDKQLNHVALLARLNLKPEEREPLRRDLSDILAYVAKLKEVDVASVEPTSHALPQKNVFIGEDATARLAKDDVLGNAPGKSGDLFKVPRVIDEGGEE